MIALTCNMAPLCFFSFSHSLTHLIFLFLVPMPISFRHVYLIDLHIKYHGSELLIFYTVGSEEKDIETCSKSRVYFGAHLLISQETLNVGN